LVDTDSVLGLLSRLLIRDLRDRSRRERGELTGEGDSGEGAQVVDGEGAPVVLEVNVGLYEVHRSSGMMCV
jgi:hypothetical protein